MLIENFVLVLHHRQWYRHDPEPEQRLDQVLPLPNHQMIADKVLS
jgi:hypothetical protein